LRDGLGGALIRGGRADLLALGPREQLLLPRGPRGPRLADGRLALAGERHGQSTLGIGHGGRSIRLLTCWLQQFQQPGKQVTPSPLAAAGRLVVATSRTRSTVAVARARDSGEVAYLSSRARPIAWCSRSSGWMIVS